MKEKDGDRRREGRRMEGELLPEDGAAKKLPLQEKVKVREERKELER